MPLKLIPPGQRHGSPYFYLRGTVRGIGVDESTGTDDLEAAEAIRARREVELLDESIHGRRAVATFASAVVSYIEAGGERRFLAPIVKAIGSIKLAAITQDLIDDLARKLYAGRKASTISRQLITPITSVLHHGARRKWCDAPAFERPRQPRERLRWLKPAEARRLVGAASLHLRPLILFLLFTGCRLGSALALDWDEVSLLAGKVVFRDTKNGEDVTRPLDPPIVAILANLPHREGRVFRRPDGRPYAEREAEGGQIKRAFEGARRRAGLSDDVTPHVLRHTWATWDHAIHRDIRRLMEYGPWKDVRMAMRYAHHALHMTEFPDLTTGLDRPDLGEKAGTASPPTPQVIDKKSA